MRAPDDDTLLAGLRHTRDRIRQHERAIEALRRERLQQAGVLRERGVVMAVLAKAAGVSDTYLARRLIEDGHKPRTLHIDRGRRR